MTREVLLKVQGLQIAPGEESEAIEVIAPGEYYFRNGKHYFLYDEVMEGQEESTRNIIKVRNDYMELTKKGVVNVHMVFEKNKSNLTYYDTPYGQIQVGIHTRDMDVNVTEDLIQVEVEYGLDINHEAMADCRISMNIRPKEAADSVLKEKNRSSKEWRQC